MATEKAVERANRGEFGLTQVGKIATLYPDTPVLALRLVTELERLLRGVEGPVIDGDLRVSRVAPIYSRWGAFVTEKAGGGAVTDADGAIIEDDRRLSQHAKLRRKPPFRYAQDRAPGEPWSDRYLPVECMAVGQFGLVYRGIDLDQIRSCVIKVRREYCGIDSQGFDGADRLAREYASLQRYGALLRGPEPIALIAEGGRLAMVTTLIEGDRAEGQIYGRATQLRLGRQLRELMGLAHRAQVLLRDLRSENVLVEHATFRVRLVDFEFIGPRDRAEFDAVGQSVVSSASLLHDRQSDLESCARLLSEWDEAWAPRRRPESQGIE
ncbi:MAG: hypothetical protein QM733_04590 [Ilumatobacteraceae bacterium]